MPDSVTREDVIAAAARIDELVEHTPLIASHVGGARFWLKCECLQTGGRWVHLRRCLTCGHIGCCDSSPSRHATGHFQSTGHPLVQSFEPGEDWVWCYADEVGLEVEGMEGSPSHP